MSRKSRIKSKRPPMSDAARDFLSRNFTNLEDAKAYLREKIAEEERVKEAQKRRSLREGDRFSRETVVVDEIVFWRSIVIRADDSVEIWMRRYREEDDNATVCNTTHKGFTLVVHLHPQQDNERNTP